MSSIPERYAVPQASAENAERVVVHRKCGVLRHHQRDAVDDEAGANRGDEWVDAHDRDEQSVRQAEREAGGDRRGESEQRRMRLANIGGDDRAERAA
jgi:hypothetical protein